MPHSSGARTESHAAKHAAGSRAERFRARAAGEHLRRCTDIACIGDNGTPPVRAEFVCDGCGKRFTTQQGCSAHRRATASRVRRRRCCCPCRSARVVNDRVDADTDDDEPGAAAAARTLPRVPPNLLLADARGEAEQAAQLPRPSQLRSRDRQQLRSASSTSPSPGLSGAARRRGALAARERPTRTCRVDGRWSYFSTSSYRAAPTPEFGLTSGTDGSYQPARRVESVVLKSPKHSQRTRQRTGLEATVSGSFPRSISKNGGGITSRALGAEPPRGARGGRRDGGC